MLFKVLAKQNPNQRPRFTTVYSFILCSSFSTAASASWDVTALQGAWKSVSAKKKPQLEGLGPKSGRKRRRG
jgi:hypothetical protein